MLLLSTQPLIKNSKPRGLNFFQSNAVQAGLNPSMAIFGFVLSWVVFFVVLNGVPLASGFNADARAVLAITGWVMVIWVFDVLPKSTSGLMIPVLLILTGVFSKPADAFAGFTTNEVFLCLGAFILAALMQVTGVDKRIALGVLSKVKPKVPNLLSGLFISHVISALFVPSTAARAAIFLPAVNGMNKMFGTTDAEKRARKALAMAGIGFGAVFAAPIFLTGHMCNVIIAGLLNSKADANITWSGWCWLHWPMLGMIPIMWWWVVHHFRLKGVEIPGNIQKMGGENRKFPAVSYVEKVVLACFLIAVILWATDKFHGLQSGIVTLIAVGFLFIPGLLPLSWKEVQEKTIWGTWLLVAGALSLVAAFTKTGLDKFMAEKMVELVPQWGWFGVMLFVMVLVQFLRLGIISNVFAVTLMAPIVFAMAPLLQLNSIAFTLAILNVDTYAMLIPMEVTACLVAYASEEFTFIEFMKAGTPLTVMVMLYIALIMVPWWAINGYPMWVP